MSGLKRTLWLSVWVGVVLLGPPCGKAWAEESTVVKGTLPQAPANLPVYLEAGTGGTGATVRSLVEKDLRRSDLVVVSPKAAGAHRVSIEASASRVEGVVHGPDGEELLRSRYDAPDLRISAHQLADDIVFAMTHVPGLASTRIAFVRGRGAAQEICLTDVAGEAVRTILKDGSPCGHPRLSRDGSLLLFTSYRTGRPVVEMLDMTTGKRMGVSQVPGLASGAELAPDGSRLAVVMSFEGGIGLYLAGAEEPEPHRLWAGDGVIASPSWSPDGSRIAASVDRGNGPQLALIDVRTGKVRHPGLGPARRVTSPAWAPEGNRIVFTENSQGRNMVGLWDIGTGRTRSLGPGEDPAWGVDSRHVIVSTGHALAIVDTETGNRREIVTSDAVVGEPTWSH